MRALVQPPSLFSLPPNFDNFAVSTRTKIQTPAHPFGIKSSRLSDSTYMNPGIAREWPPVNPLDALLSNDGRISYRPRVVIVAAHSCDVIAAVGGHLSRWKVVGLVITTKFQDGANGAGALAGLRAGEILSLGYAPQETPAHLMQVTRDLESILQRLSPDIVIAQAYEGGDCDRDAAAFAVHHAARTLRKRPLLVEMTGWHATGGARSLGEFLHRPGACERIAPLTPEERARKRELLELLPELRARVSDADLHVEHFRMAPCYDFTRPPHPGPLHYERNGTGRWTGELWRAEAARVIPGIRVLEASA